MRLSGSICSSFQIPTSPGEMRPRASTADASTRISPAPPAARLPKCTKCQSFAKPSSLEYWHMGETAVRLRKATSRILNGENRCACMDEGAGTSTIDSGRSIPL